jgi:myo-inositol-1-phosphate synthase
MEALVAGAKVGAGFDLVLGAGRPPASRGMIPGHGTIQVGLINLAGLALAAGRGQRARFTNSLRRAVEAALDAGTSQPASAIYAYAALKSGRPFINFTPSLGSTLPALRELADKQGVPHAGNDGKTGETLVKTVLAPMFAARALRVKTWQGYNMLGNRDGEVLRDEAHRESKLRNKDEALRSILGEDPDLHSKVGIDFVPSLGDWKTAWDFVHFEGFLGARMKLQFTWEGSDSALAAPLIIDLARLADFAAEVGESGEMAHTACFFKAPIAGGSHDFHRQHVTLLEYAARHSAR